MEGIRPGFSWLTWDVFWRNPVKSGKLLRKELKQHVSHEKNPGWLFGIGDYTTQLYGDYNKPL